MFLSSFSCLGRKGSLTLPHHAHIGGSQEEYSFQDGSRQIQFGRACEGEGSDGDYLWVDESVRSDVLESVTAVFGIWCCEFGRVASGFAFSPFEGESKAGVW